MTQKKPLRGFKGKRTQYELLSRNGRGVRPSDRISRPIMPLPCHVHQMPVKTVWRYSWCQRGSTAGHGENLETIWKSLRTSGGPHQQIPDILTSTVAKRSWGPANAAPRAWPFSPASRGNWHR